MELRSWHGISGSQTKPRATSEGRKAVGTNRIDQPDNVNNMTCVNSPSSPTGIVRGGKSPIIVYPSRHGDSWESLECHPLSYRPGASLHVCSGWWIVELLRLPVVPAARPIRSPAGRARHFGVHRLVVSKVSVHSNYLGKGKIV